MGEIIFNNVSKNFGSVAALRDVSFTVADGEFVSLLGPSGCGKTTSLSLIAGMLLPSAGEIYISGRLVNDVPMHKRNTGMVFQSFALFPHMSVADNVAFGLKMKKYPRKEIRKKTAEALRLVNMEGYEKRRPDELSGGQQQRAALARALVFDPDVLLLDEPLSNLDSLLRENLRREIRSLHNKTGKTVIFVTHDQIEALSLSDRIILMNCGRVVEAACPYHLYSSPATAFAAAFIGVNSFINCRVIDVKDSGLVTVEFCGLSLTAPGSGQLAKGHEALFAIRPENIHLLTEENKYLYRNKIEGRIVYTVFQGADTIVCLEVGGALLKAAVSNCSLRAARRPAVGDKVIVGLSDGMVFSKGLPSEPPVRG